MIGTRKPLTALGKALGLHALENDLTRNELAAQIGVSGTLLHKLMHGGNFAPKSVERAIEHLGNEITPEEAEAFRLAANHKPNVYEFKAEAGTNANMFLLRLRGGFNDMDEEEFEALCNFMLNRGPASFPPGVYEWNGRRYYQISDALPDGKTENDLSQDTGRITLSIPSPETVVEGLMKEYAKGEEGVPTGNTDSTPVVITEEVAKAAEEVAEVIFPAEDEAPPKKWVGRENALSGVAVTSEELVELHDAGMVVGADPEEIEVRLDAEPTDDADRRGSTDL